MFSSYKQPLQMKAPRECQENEPFRTISVFYASQNKYKSLREWDI